jgi:hypothetical protein
MSLDVWLSRGKKVQIGGRDLIMMPLPLSKLKQIGHWLEDSCDDLVREVRTEIRAGAAAPNPLTMVTRILLKVDVVETVFEIFSLPKDPVTREPINKDLSKEFFEEYLDIPASHSVYNAFVELNQLEKLLKNLQSLPIAKDLMTAGMSTFGIPFLNTLLQNTDSAQKTSGGSLTRKSTDTLEQRTSSEQDPGTLKKSELQSEPLHNQEEQKTYLQ